MLIGEVKNANNNINNTGTNKIAIIENFKREICI